jgi:hypothetical protein
MEKRGGIAVPRWSTQRGEIVQNPVNDLLAQAKITWVNWESSELRPIDIGGYSVIYSVVPGLIAKVGLIEHGEVEAQRMLSSMGLALPVLDFAAVHETSAAVRRAVCSVHGIRPVVENTCTCHEPLGVLFMPEAQGIEGFGKKEIERFMVKVAAICYTQLGRLWDMKVQNLASYHGHLVALDFGDPEREDW